jgi:hypothetical protein
VSLPGTAKFFSDAGQFLERVQPFLLRRGAEHCLILGLLDGLRAGEQWGPAPPLMASAEEHGEVTAVALMTPPHNLVLSWTADDSTSIRRSGTNRSPMRPSIRSHKNVAGGQFSSWLL